MPHLTLPISAGGPILDFGVGVSVPRAKALKAGNQFVPQPVSIRGLIDTGASGTCIDPRCLTALALIPTGQALIHTPSTGSTPHPCNQYDVSIAFISQALIFTLPAVAIIESNLELQGIDALVGRDLLSRCLLVYDGAAGTFALGF